MGRGWEWEGASTRRGSSERATSAVLRSIAAMGVWPGAHLSRQARIRDALLRKGRGPRGRYDECVRARRLAHVTRAARAHRERALSILALIALASIAASTASTAGSSTSTSSSISASS